MLAVMMGEVSAMTAVHVHPGSKMSFTGGTRWVASLGWRQWAGGLWHAAQEHEGWAKAGLLTGAAAVVVLLIGLDYLLLAAVWTAVAAWYVLIFGVFGLLVFPWRIWMRGRRRSAAQQQALLDEVRALRR
jgi:Flp pilus assembly protein TadB